MAISVKYLLPSEQGELLSLHPSDTWRDGKVVRLTSIAARPFFWIRELFSGGRAFNDRKALDLFYARVKENILVLQADLERGDNLAITFPQIQTMLKIQAKIANSSWAKNRGPKNHTYRSFHQDVGRLRQAAAKKVDDWAAGDFAKHSSVARWIHANDKQRRFAAFLDLGEVPYRFNEIPRGAVILTDPRLYLKSTQLNQPRKGGSIQKTIILHIKAFLCWMATGKRHTHAELSLGNGEALDLDKRWLQGEMKIQSRGNGICYGAVVAANEEKMLQAHQQKFREKGLTPLESFEDLWAAIDKEARDSAPRIQATVLDVIRVVLISKRPSDYDAMDAWQPGVKTYGCSATTSALFSKFGIDIGKEFGKKDANIAPADFLSSEFFSPFFAPD